MLSLSPQQNELAYNKINVKKQHRKKKKKKKKGREHEFSNLNVLQLGEHKDKKTKAEKLKKA